MVRVVEEQLSLSSSRATPSSSGRRERPSSKAASNTAQGCPVSVELELDSLCGHNSQLRKRYSLPDTQKSPVLADEPNRTFSSCCSYLYGVVKHYSWCLSHLLLHAFVPLYIFFLLRMALQNLFILLINANIASPCGRFKIPAYQEKDFT